MKKGIVTECDVFDDQTKPGQGRRIKVTVFCHELPAFALRIDPPPATLLMTTFALDLSVLRKEGRLAHIAPREDVEVVVLMDFGRATFVVDRAEWDNNGKAAYARWLRP